MKLNDVIRSLNQHLMDVMFALSQKAKTIYYNGTAHTDQFVAYQIIMTDDPGVRFNIIVSSDAPYASAQEATEEDAKITTYIEMRSRKGKAAFKHGYNEGVKGNVEVATEPGVGLDDLIPWIWLADTESQRLTTSNDFPSTNIIGVGKKIVYEIDLGEEASVAVGNTLQLALDPAVTNQTADANVWVSDNPTIATVSQWVDGGSLGGLVTGVAVGQTYIRNNLGPKILITVT